MQGTPTLNERFTNLNADRKAELIKRASEVKPDQLINAMHTRWQSMQRESVARFENIEL
jgi:hypothetical protein